MDILLNGIYTNQNPYEWMRHTILWGFDKQTNDLIGIWWPNLVVINKNIRTCRLMDFVPVNHDEKIIDSKMIDEFLNLDKELKKLSNMKVIMTHFVISSSGRPSKCVKTILQELEIIEWVETIQPKTLLRSIRLLSFVSGTGGDLLLFRLQG